MRENAWWAYGFIASITPCPWGVSVRNQPFGLVLYVTFTSDLELVTCELGFLCTCVRFDQHGVFKN